MREFFIAIVITSAPLPACLLLCPHDLVSRVLPTVLVENTGVDKKVQDET